MTVLKNLRRPVFLSLLPLLLLACPPDEKGEKATATSSDAALHRAVPACVNSPEPQAHAFVALGQDPNLKTAIDLFDTTEVWEPVIARWKPPASDNPKAQVWAAATHLLVTLRPGVASDQARAAATAALGENLDVQPTRLPRVYRVGLFGSSDKTHRLGRNAKLLSALSSLRSLPEVQHVELDYILFIDDTTPHDTHYSSQDDLIRIKAPAAWDSQKGSKSIRVAVIDTGIDDQHPDLKDNLAKENGSVLWKDLVNGNPAPYDDESHGTLCAGIIGAVGDNDEGIAGVNWHVSILPIKAFNDKGCASSSTAVDAIEFAIQNKADVISASWGGFTGADATVLQTAIDDAERAKILFVAAAGNVAIDLDTTQYFPASSSSSNVISVGASDDSDGRSASGFGKHRVHLSAPGTDVLSTTPTPYGSVDPYGPLGGTSAATAFVAGACALVKAQHPTLSYSDIRNLILSGTDLTGTLSGASCTEGRLNVANAVKRQNLRTVNCP